MSDKAAVTTCRSIRGRNEEEELVKRRRVLKRRKRLGRTRLMNCGKKLRLAWRTKFCMSGEKKARTNDAFMARGDQPKWIEENITVTMCKDKENTFGEMHNR